jgi:hypothetical protein
MRKGLVVTLGVALALSVAPAFAEAPIISCLPDIIISDFDKTAQTADTNLFVFSDALDLDEYVVDYDTSVTALRWSFIETTGNAIRINGCDEITLGQQLEPGAKDIRAASPGGNGFISLQNVVMTGASTQSMISTLEFWVSDGTASRSESVLVTTVNTNGTTGSVEDALVPPVVRQWTFEAGADGWTWFDQAGGALDYAVPTHQVAGGSLQIGKTVAATKITFGSYESPKSPTAGVQPKVGCILRGTFKMRGSGNASPAGFPGFRLQALTAHMVNAGGGNWSPNFATQDYLDYQKVLFDSLAFTYIAGREPTATVKNYEILSYPFQAAETLMSTDTVTYFTCDLLDNDFTVNDVGTIFVDEMVVDAIDRPELGAGTRVDALTSSSFASGSWTGAHTNINAGGTYNDVGLVTAVQSGALVITVAPGNQSFEAYLSYNNAIALDVGKWYRMNWVITSTVAPGENFGPRVRVALQSTRFNWVSHKDLDGGGLIAVFDSTPRDTELWSVAPAPGLTGNQTEPMRPVFESWLTASNTNWPFYKTIAGTTRCIGLTTEVFDPVPVP